MRYLWLVAVLAALSCVSEAWCQGGRSGGRAQRPKRGSPPQLMEPRVYPTEGYNGVFGLLRTSFTFTVKYRDADRDAPRELTSEAAGPGVRQAAMPPQSIPSGRIPPSGFTAIWQGKQKFEKAGRYTVSFHAEDKDGPAVAPNPVAFTVKNLPLILGICLAGILGGYLLTNLLALAFCFFLNELPAALLAWAVYLLAVPTIIITAFGLWGNTNLVIVFYIIAVIGVMAMVGLAMLQRSRVT